MLAQSLATHYKGLQGGGCIPRPRLAMHNQAVQRFAAGIPLKSTQTGRDSFLEMRVFALPLHQTHYSGKVALAQTRAFGLSPGCFSVLGEIIVCVKLERAGDKG